MNGIRTNQKDTDTRVFMAGWRPLSFLINYYFDMSEQWEGRGGGVAQPTGR